MAKVLTPGQVEQIFRLREELDEWGEPKWSGAYIAEQMGVSESTVWRVLTRRAAYGVKKAGRQAAEKAQWSALLNDSFELEGKAAPAGLAQAAKESERRFMQQLERERALVLSPEAAERAARYGARVAVPEVLVQELPPVRKAPLSPMEGGEYPGDEGVDEPPPSGLTRLVRELNELKGAQ
jgi:hypothetical protein